MGIYQYKRVLCMSTALLAFAVSLPVAAGSPDVDRLDNFQRIIEQQQRMIEAQSRTLEALKQQIEDLKTATRSNTEAVAKSEQAVKQAVRKVEQAATPPKMVTSGSDKVKLSLSGQVNRVSFAADDGTESNFFHSDNENSSTRWRLVGSARLTDDFAIGSKIEQDIGQTNNSASVNITTETSVSDVSFDNRHLTIYADSKKFGRLWLGKGDTSSNNITQIDLSGTSVIEYSGLEDVGGSLVFRTKNADSPDGPAVSGGSDAIGGGAYTQFDGLSRRNRIQYDTPTIAGFKAGLTHVQGNAWDVSLRYAAKYEDIGMKVSAGVAYWNYGARTNIAEGGFGGSFSLLHDSGANLTVSSGTFDREANGATIDDPVGYFIKPGWKLDLVPWGKTNVSVHYGTTDDLQAQGDEFTSWGGAVVQNVDAAGAELFAFFRQYELDRTGSSFEDLDLGGIGARIKF